uniref:Alpha-2-macroglobulin receptor-associated protein-like n=1 Tax=Hirondellea gigas TaxID=1518452 RepID=A0A2P2I5J3_9CRUS
MAKYFLGILLCLILIGSSACLNFNQVNEKNVRELKKPYRMAKFNLIWDKALQSQLSSNKLLQLMFELKVQDKQELTLKKHKTEGGDKDGQMEAQLRKTLKQMMDRYRLGRSSDETVDSGNPSQAHQNLLFKDKKLNRLWEKAERSGFTQVELKALREEFQHHQDKVDEYHSLLRTPADTAAHNNELDFNDAQSLNHFSSMEENEIPGAGLVNSIREKHRDLKEGYHRLHKLSTSAADSKEFIEPKVAGLWKLAAAADFTTEELESLHTELKHYENRLLKVRHLTGELLRLRKTGGVHDEHPDRETQLEQKLNEVSQTEGDRLLQGRVAKQRRTVDKLHMDLENRILQRHSEL